MSSLNPAVIRILNLIHACMSLSTEIFRSRIVDVHFSSVDALAIESCFLARVLIHKLNVYLICMEIHDLRSQNAVVVSDVRD